MTTTETRTGHHPCPGPGEVHSPGQAQVPNDLLSCSRHWYQVPKPLQNRVYQAWNHGDPADEHLALCAEAVGYMTELAPPRPRK